SVMGASNERLRQPRAHVDLAPGLRRAKLVDREPRDHRRQVRARRLDPPAALALPVQAQEPLLHHVLGLAHAAEHPVGDGKRRRAGPGAPPPRPPPPEALRRAHPPPPIAGAAPPAPPPPPRPGTPPPRHPRAF